MTTALTGVAERLRELVAALSLAATAPRTLLLPAADRRAGCDPFRVHERLCQLTDAMFEQIAAQAGIDRDSFAPRAAPLAERALDIALLVALDPVLCRRLSTELDRPGALDPLEHADIELSPYRSWTLKAGRHARYAIGPSDAMGTRWHRAPARSSTRCVSPA